MSPQERKVLRERLAWMRMDHAVDVDRLLQIYAIREEASAAARDVATRVRQGLRQIRKAGAALRPARIESREATNRNGRAVPEPAIPAVNRGAG